MCSHPQLVISPWYPHDDPPWIMGTKRPSYPWDDHIAYARGLADGRLATPSVVDEEGHHGLEDCHGSNLWKRERMSKWLTLCTIYIYICIHIYIYICIHIYIEIQIYIYIAIWQKVFWAQTLQRLLCPANHPSVNSNLQRFSHVTCVGLHWKWSIWRFPKSHRGYIIYHISYIIYHISYIIYIYIYHIYIYIYISYIYIYIYHIYIYHIYICVCDTPNNQRH